VTIHVAMMIAAFNTAKYVGKVLLGVRQIYNEILALGLSESPDSEIFISYASLCQGIRHYRTYLTSGKDSAIWNANFTMLRGKGVKTLAFGTIPESKFLDELTFHNSHVCDKVTISPTDTAAFLWRVGEIANHLWMKKQNEPFPYKSQYELRNHLSYQTNKN
jgi:hypothetical protein